jgi:Cu/Ag efflux protein CusF
MEVTKEDFEAYKEVQESGMTNMFDVKNVAGLSGLEREQISYIMDNYEELQAEFLPTIEA